MNIILTHFALSHGVPLPGNWNVGGGQDCSNTNLPLADVVAAADTAKMEALRAGDRSRENSRDRDRWDQDRDYRDQGRDRDYRDHHRDRHFVKAKRTLK